MNIGSNASNLNRNNSYFLIGLNNNVSILNLNRSLLNLKKKINFVIKYSKYTNNLNFLLINTDVNKILINRLKKICINSKCSYFFGNWWNGLLKSFKKYIKYKNSKKIKKFNFFYHQYPKFTFYINRQKYGQPNLNTVPITKELNNISMKNIMFFNNFFDLDKNPSAVLVNTRTYLNNLFLFHLSMKIVKKCDFISKKKFILSVLINYFLNFKNRKLFYEYMFCFKNKKNLLKLTLWNDDLK